MNESKINQWLKEDISFKETCNHCQESCMEIGQKSGYGAVIIFKVGDSNQNGWFATLSPKTGGREDDFTIQLMPWGHLTHFSQINQYPELAKNYGIGFAKINNAIAQIMVEENPNFDIAPEKREHATSVAAYGKSTNWKEKKEHLHIKIFPFRGNIGQPYTVDSSFGRKEIYNDENNQEFVKMNPVKKTIISPERFKYLTQKLITLLK
ncbi:MAG: hypothetical protein KAT77_01900 [Nanoarchaeota archaeon]|nr:hypothetical protein [Nanoarchaeota archaeon]